MSALCGIFYKNDDTKNKYLIEKLNNSLAHRGNDGNGIYKNNFAAIGHQLLHTNEYSLIENLPLKSSCGNYVITCDARLDNREELFKKLNIPNEHSKEIPDSQLILDSFRNWRYECVHHLLGDFTFAIWDIKKKEFYIANDYMGIRPLFYFSSEQVFLFASEIKAILENIGFTPELDDYKVAEHLLTIIKNCGKTIYSGILKLLPGRYMIINGQSLKTVKYYEANESSIINYKNDRDYIDEFKYLLHESIKCRINSPYEIGSELSSGLDSTSITLIAKNFLNERNKDIMAFSNVLPDGDSPIYNEQPQISETRKFAGITKFYENSRIPVNILENLQSYFNKVEVPVIDSFSYFSQYNYEEAKKNNIRILLSGAGGDQFVSAYYNNYIHDINPLEDIKLFLNQCKIIASKTDRSFLRLVLSQIISRSIILNKLRSLLPSDKKNYTKFEESLLLKDFKERIDVTKLFDTKEFLGHSAAYENLINGFIGEWYFERFIHAQWYNVEYVYPLLDKRLTEYYNSLPYYMKNRDGFGRYIFRESVRNIIPENVRLSGNKEGSISPVMLWFMFKLCKAFIDKRIMSKGSHYTKVDIDKMNNYIIKIKDTNTIYNHKHKGKYFFKAPVFTLFQNYLKESYMNNNSNSKNEMKNKNIPEKLKWHKPEYQKLNLFKTESGSNFTKFESGVNYTDS